MEENTQVRVGDAHCATCLARVHHREHGTALLCQRPKQRDPQAAVRTPLLASLDGELASLSAKLRWHASAPFRSKKDEAPEGQLAFELLGMLTGRLGQEPAADDTLSEGDVQPSEGDKPSDDAPSGRGWRPNRGRRGRGLRRKVNVVKLEDAEIPRCPCCAKPLGEMGFDRRERFIYKPAEVYILEAGERYANLLTVLLNCELAGVNPYVYLVDVIDKIADDWPADRAAELLPRAWLAVRQAEQQAPGQAAVVAGLEVTRALAVKALLTQALDAVEGVPKHRGK